MRSTRLSTTPFLWKGKATLWPDTSKVDEGGQKAVINEEKCMGCGVCEDKCTVEAISLRLEPSRFDPLDIETMKNQVL